MLQEKKNISGDLKIIYHKINSLYSSYAKSVGLNYPFILVLQILCDPSQVYTQKAICDELELPKQLVNSIVKTLWEQGYIELEEAKDRRNKEIFLTQHGKRYAAKILKPLAEAEDAALKDVTFTELTNLIIFMEKYRKTLKNAIKKQGAK